MIDPVQWRSDVSRWGLLRSGYIRTMRLLRPWLTLFAVHVREQDPAAGMDGQQTGISVRIANRAELLRAAQDPVMELNPVSIDAALLRGDICVAAFDHSRDSPREHASDHERLVSYTWRSFTTAPHVDGLWVTFERPYRYGYKGFTHPDYRGRHLQDLVTYETDALCIERGFRYGLVIIETHNFASVVSNTRRGGRVVGWAGYVKLSGRVFPFRSRGARRHTFRFVKPSAHEAPR